jgi:phosphatidate cytidylyltransferase
MAGYSAVAAKGLWNRELWVRSLVAAGLLSVLAGSFYLPMLLRIVIVLVCTGCLMEGLFLLRRTPSALECLSSGVLAAGVAVAYYYLPVPDWGRILALVLTVLLLTVVLPAPHRPPLVTTGAWSILMGLSCGQWLSVLPPRLLEEVAFKAPAALDTIFPLFQALPYLVVLAVCCFDTGCYLNGRLFGKRKILPITSPNKTWEGFWGGVGISSLVFGGGLWMLANWGTGGLAISWWWPAAMFPVLIMVAFLGDYAESRLKRSMNCKDSGFLLPGHGGLLDRFDSLLLMGWVVWGIEWILLSTFPE